MIQFVARRLLLGIPTVIGVSVIVFSIIHVLPGDPAQIMLAGATGVTPKLIASLHHQLGLDRPLYVQYLSWLWQAVHGDLGRSIRDGSPVLPQIVQNAPSTFALAVLAMVIAIGTGVVLGTIAAAYQHSWIDNLAVLLGTVGTAIPNFWAAVLLILVFSILLGWFPSTGEGDIQHLILPAAALGFDFAAVNTRMVRSGMIEVLQQDYIRTARAKGLSRLRVVLKHALKNSLIPVATIAGVQFGNLLGGAVVIEIVFARQGLGRMLLTGIQGKDYPLVQGVVLFIAIVYVLVNLAVDLSYGLLDPRIRQR
jgi:peptide/nickel transport system permease protein